tara:strand:- start:2 stop:865 length:864 start_codon:yes stop_codon:yes gene_type:complete
MSKLRIIIPLVFITLFLISVNDLFKEKNLTILKDNVKFFIKKFKASQKFKQCPIEKIDYVPEESVVVIGHAYGNPENQNLFLAPKVSSFLSNHSSNIDVVFFTGDVFQTSSDDKWSWLATYFKDDFKIFIAPGNHDVGTNENPKKTAFYSSPYYLPTSEIVNLQGIDFILEDSIKSNWLVDTATIELINTSQNEVILLRHNIASKDILDVANSDAGISDNLPNKLGEAGLINKDLIILSGDGGAKAYMPRTFCRQSGRIFEIVNGIGEHPDDEVVIINKGQIYLHRI